MKYSQEQSAMISGIIFERLLRPSMELSLQKSLVELCSHLENGNLTRSELNTIASALSMVLPCFKNDHEQLQIVHSALICTNAMLAKVQ